jgi:Ca2+-binding EF-hand superfamily protein
MEALFVDFSSADTDGDGFVSKAEFAAYRQKQTGAAPTADDWKAFYACDRNADGQISRAEFEQFKESTSVSSSGRPRLLLDTMQIDVDGSADSAQTPEPACELGVLDDGGFFDKADSDNDGYVSKSEFVEYCYTQQGSAPTAGDWKMYYSADTNGDGRISRVEFDEYRRTLWAAAAEYDDDGGDDDDGDAGSTASSFSSELLQRTIDDAIELVLSESDAGSPDGASAATRQSHESWPMTPVEQPLTMGSGMGMDIKGTAEDSSGGGNAPKATPKAKAKAKAREIP